MSQATGSARDGQVRLLLDLGNTRLKWVLARGSRFLHEPEAVAADPAGLPWARWRQAGAGVVAMAAVAPPEVTAGITTAVRARLGARLEVAHAVAVWGGLRCAYRQPQRLGVDRWLAMLAAYHQDPGTPALVVSAGTALTVDRLDPGGNHRGGLIAPGLAAMRSGLVGAAPALAAHAGGRAGPGLAADSADAIASGCLQACLGLIGRCADAMAAEGLPPRLWLGGGDAGLLAPHLPGAVELRPWLVLEGLAIWAGGSPPGLQPG